MFAPGATLRDPLTHQKIFHIEQRAAHIGFLCVTVRPLRLPDGFAAFFLSTLSPMVSDNRRIARVFVHSESMTGDMQSEAMIHEGCERPGVFDTVVTDQLRAFVKLAGTESYLALLQCLERGRGDLHDCSGVGIYKDRAEFLPKIGDRDWQINRHHFLFPLGRFLEQCLEPRILGWETDAPIVLRNLREQHLARFVPR